MGKFRKKPVEVEAWQFSHKNFREGAPDFIVHSGVVTLWSQYGGKVIGGEIKTLEGTMKISEDDWIIKGVNGEFYPCKPDIFKKTYKHGDPMIEKNGVQFYIVWDSWALPLMIDFKYKVIRFLCFGVYLK